MRVASRNGTLAALALAVTATGAAPPGEGREPSILGEPGYYGRIDVEGGFYRPRVINSRPLVTHPRYRNMATIYVRAPRAHQHDWKQHCARYDACTRPVHFVRDEWYTDVYAPRYRQLHARNFEGRVYPQTDRDEP